MPKVLVTPSPLQGLDGPYLHALRAAGFEVTFSPKPGQLSEVELIHELRGASAAIAGSEPYSVRVFEATPTLRVVARAGVGYDAIDLAAATAHGVAVTIAPGTNQDAVAEHTFALILNLAKGVVVQHNALREGRWMRQATLPLRGRVLGIAGLGRIGKAVALRGVAFGMRLLAYEPYPDVAFADRHGVKLVPFELLLAESDYLSLHLPLVPESKHLFNRRTLALLKPTAFLINTARGGLVCEADLVEALRGGRLAGAGLDVFEEEPPRAENPLLAMESVVVTPHAAGVDVQSRDDMALAAAGAIIALSRGEWPTEKVVNADVRPRFRW
jgi:D-3-phosphoglycerate dehydrogenase / 2-oxoglutarate reductase